MPKDLTEKREEKKKKDKKFISCRLIKYIHSLSIMISIKWIQVH